MNKLLFIFSQWKSRAEPIQPVTFLTEFKSRVKTSHWARAPPQRKQCHTFTRCKQCSGLCRMWQHPSRDCVKASEFRWNAFCVSAYKTNMKYCSLFVINKNVKNTLQRSSFKVVIDSYFKNISTNIHPATANSFLRSDTFHWKPIFRSDWSQLKQNTAFCLQ